MAKSKLIKDFINSQMTIDTALQNLLVILNDFDNENLTNWARKELTGYNSDDEIPKYRQLTGIVKASFIVGYLKYSTRPFPINHLDKDMKENLLSAYMYSSISTLVEAIKENKNLCKPIPPELYPMLQSSSNAHIDNAYVDVDISNIIDLVSTVKTKILDTLLLLEKEFGNLDDLDIDLSNKTTEEKNTIIKKLYINLYDNSVSIGNNNKIKNSDIATNQ